MGNYVLAGENSIMLNEVFYFIVINFNCYTTHLGKILQVTRPKIFWTPCAAHCLDLMLEDIGKIPKVKRVIQRGIKLVGYIYNHTLALNTMRKFTQKTELVRHGVTRFATTFLTLQRLHKQKANLRRMFNSDEWLKSKAAKEPKGKQATASCKCVEVGG